jgi:hypothetical protein
MITLPGEENIERMSGFRTAAEVRIFAESM